MKAANFATKQNNRRIGAFERLNEDLKAYEKAIAILSLPKAKDQALVCMKWRTVDQCQAQVKRINVEIAKLQSRIVSHPVAQERRTKKYRGGLGSAYKY